jgi:hypothetical protein
MSTPTSFDDLLIEKLRTHLEAEGYSRSIQRWYPTLAGHFLNYCVSKRLLMDAVHSAHIAFLTTAVSAVLSAAPRVATFS